MNEIGKEYNEYVDKIRQEYVDTLNKILDTIQKKLERYLEMLKMYEKCNEKEHDILFNENADLNINSIPKIKKNLEQISIIRKNIPNTESNKTIFEIRIKMERVDKIIDNLRNADNAIHGIYSDYCRFIYFEKEQYISMIEKGLE